MRLPTVSRRTIRLALVAFVSLALVAGAVVLARRAEAPDPQTEFAEAEAALVRGNYSAARNHAASATKVRPDWAAAHVLLARAYLLLGDGVPAEGEVQRALAAGLPVAASHYLLAEAYLIQGDSERAAAEAARAPAEHAAAGVRVRARALADEGDYPAAARLLADMVARDPDDAIAWRDLGRIRQSAGDFQGANAAAIRAVALDRADLDALTLRGELVRGQYGLVAALPWFEAALARDAYFHPALIEYAATLGDLGRYAEMLEATRRALAARPGSPEALYLQSVMAARAGRLDLAAAMLARTGGQIDTMPGALLLAGALDYADGRYQQAIGRWSDLVARQPMNLVARRLLGSAQLRSGDAAAALATLRPIALRADADTYTLATVARAFEATGDRGWAARFLDRAAQPPAARAAPFGQDDALPVLALAVAEAPGSPSAAVDYVRGLIEVGDTGLALAQAQSIARASPGAPAAHLLVGDTLMTLGRAAPAVDAYRRAADLDFGAPTLLRLVEASDRAGQNGGAANALALYLGQNPQSIVARRVAGNLRLGARDWTAAIDTLEGLRGSLGNRDLVLLVQLSRAYAGAGDAATAARYARAAYALQPMSAGAADAFGWGRYLSGDAAAGLELVGKAARIAPGDPMIRWHLAQLLAEAGRTGEARRVVAAALADPAFADRAGAVALQRLLAR